MSFDYMRDIIRAATLVDKFNVPTAFTSISTIASAIATKPFIPPSQKMINAIVGTSSLLNAQAVVSKIPFNSIHSLAQSVAVTGSLTKILSRPQFDHWNYRGNILHAITSQHAVVGSISSIIQAIHANKPITGQLSALAGLVTASFPKAAFTAAARNDMVSLGLVEEISHRVEAFTADISNRGFEGTEDIGVFKGLVDQLKTVPKSDMQWYIGMVVTILLWLISYYYPAPGTETSRASFNTFNQIVVEIKANNPSHAIDKILSKSLPLKAKASARSESIQTLPSGTKVTVLDLQSNWAYVMLTTTDGLPACGWIEAKYFAKNSRSKTFITRQLKNRQR